MDLIYKEDAFELSPPMLPLFLLLTYSFKIKLKTEQREGIILLDNKAQLLVLFGIM